MEVGSQRHSPAALPPGKTRYSLYRRLDGPQGRSGQVRKIKHPTGFDTGILQSNKRNSSFPFSAELHFFLRPIPNVARGLCNFREHSVWLAGGSSVGSRLISCMCNAHHSRSGEGTLLKQVWRNAGHSSDFCLMNSSYSP